MGTSKSVFLTIAFFMLSTVQTTYANAFSRKLTEDLTCHLTEGSISNGYHSQEISKKVVYKWNNHVSSFSTDAWRSSIYDTNDGPMENNLEDLGFRIRQGVQEVQETRVVSYLLQLPKPSFMSFLPDFPQVKVIKQQFFFSTFAPVGLPEGTTLLHEHTVIEKVPFIQTIMTETTTLVSAGSEKVNGIVRVRYGDPACVSSSEGRGSCQRDRDTERHKELETHTDTERVEDS
eukprot:762539-Hanusia_phi.AAC.8